MALPGGPVDGAVPLQVQLAQVRTPRRQDLVHKYYNEIRPRTPGSGTQIIIGLQYVYTPFYNTVLGDVKMLDPPPLPPVAWSANILTSRIY